VPGSRRQQSDTTPTSALRGDPSQLTANPFVAEAIRAFQQGAAAQAAAVTTLASALGFGPGNPASIGCSAPTPAPTPTSHANASSHGTSHTATLNWLHQQLQSYANSKERVAPSSIGDARNVPLRFEDVGKAPHAYHGVQRTDGPTPVSTPVSSPFVNRATAGSDMLRSQGSDVFAGLQTFQQRPLVKNRCSQNDEPTTSGSSAIEDHSPQDALPLGDSCLTSVPLARPGP